MSYLNWTMVTSIGVVGEFRPSTSNLNDPAASKFIRPNFGDDQAFQMDCRGLRPL